MQKVKDNWFFVILQVALFSRNFFQCKTDRYIHIVFLDAKELKATDAWNSDEIAPVANSRIVCRTN